MEQQKSKSKPKPGKQQANTDLWANWPHGKYFNVDDLIANFPYGNPYHPEY